MQNTYYNRWLGGCYCSLLFCFGPHGTIIWCTLNFPGSWADSELAKHLYSLLETRPAGMAIPADCEFNCTDMVGKIIRPLKSNELTRFASSVFVSQFVAHVQSSSPALSIRQAAEWGMGAMQSMCGRLKHSLPAVSSERHQDLELYTHSFNFRTLTV